MKSRREIQLQVFKALDVMVQRIADGHRNGEALWTPREVKTELYIYVGENPEVQRREILVEQYYRKWERHRIQPVAKIKADGQTEFRFEYQPNAVIIYSHTDRGFMKDATFMGGLKRLRWLSDKRKKTNDAIDVQEKYWTDKLLVWKQDVHRTLDELEKEIFGWQPPPEPPSNNEEDDDDEGEELG